MQACTTTSALPTKLTPSSSFSWLLQDASERVARRSRLSRPGYRDSVAAAGFSRRRSGSPSPRALGSGEGTAGNCMNGARGSTLGLRAGGPALALLAHSRCAGATNKLHSKLLGSGAGVGRSPTGGVSTGPPSPPSVRSFPSSSVRFTPPEGGSGENCLGRAVWPNPPISLPGRSWHYPLCCASDARSRFPEFPPPLWLP